MRPMGEIDEGAVREEVAERNRRVEEDCSRMRARRGGEMGQALLHLPEEERGDRDPAEGELRARLLQGRLAQGPETHLEKDRTAAGGPLDQIHRSQRYRGTAAYPQALPPRGHPGRGVGKEGSGQESLGVCNA